MSTKVTSVQYQTHYMLWLASLIFALILGIGAMSELHNDYHVTTASFLIWCLVFLSFANAIRTRGLPNKLLSMLDVETQFTLDEIDPADFQDTNVVTIDD